MKSWERILLILSAVFAASSLVGELFWPAHFRFILDDLFFPFGLIFLVLTFFRKKEWRWLILAFACLGAWGFLSDVLLNQTVRIPPLGMLVRWLKWPIICLTIAQLGNVKVGKQVIENAVVWVFLSLAAINLIMLLNPFGWGQMINELYAPKADVILANYHEFGAFRLSGTLLNPNNNAAIFAVFLIFFLHVDARKYWKYVLLAFVFIFLTQSRTTLIISTVIIAIYTIRVNSIRLTFVMIPAAILGLFGAMMVFRSTGLLSIFDGSAFRSHSWMDRMGHYSLLWDANWKELMVGHGIILDPLAQVGFYFDSEYLSMLYQYGFIGGLIWLIALILFVLALRGRRLSKGFPVSLIILILGVSTTNFVFLNVELATLLSFLGGTWLFLQSPNELDNHSSEKSN